MIYGITVELFLPLLSKLIWIHERSRKIKLSPNEFVMILTSPIYAKPRLELNR